MYEVPEKVKMSFFGVSQLVQVLQQVKRGVLRLAEVVLELAEVLQEVVGEEWQ